METTVIAVIGICVGFMQGIVIFILSGIKGEIGAIWARMNNHYHEVSCTNDACKTVKTGNVIIHHGERG